MEEILSAELKLRTLSLAKSKLKEIKWKKFY